MRDIEKIIDKVLILLKLVQNNENEYEVTFALTKADFLIEKYKLDNVEIYKKRKSNIEPIREFVDIDLKKSYMLQLKDLISDYFPVEFLYGTGCDDGKNYIYGIKEDVDFAKSFMTSVDTFMNQEVTRIRAKINYETKYLKKSYCAGFLDGLDEKLQEITYSQRWCASLQIANRSELAGISKDFYLTGYKEGKRFSTSIIENKNKLRGTYDKNY